MEEMHATLTELPLSSEAEGCKIAKDLIENTHPSATWQHLKSFRVNCLLHLRFAGSVRDFHVPVLAHCHDMILPPPILFRWTAQPMHSVYDHKSPQYPLHFKKNNDIKVCCKCANNGLLQTCPCDTVSCFYFCEMASRKSIPESPFHGVKCSPFHKRWFTGDLLITEHLGSTRTCRHKLTNRFRPSNLSLGRSKTFPCRTKYDRKNLWYEHLWSSVSLWTLRPHYDSFSDPISFCWENSRVATGTCSRDRAWQSMFNDRIWHETERGHRSLLR